ncbi:MAG: Ger(x)C family spore germination C-terminal domain-containing protein [Candidatus Limivicinus sp.]|jgi:spore germination protein KC
MKKIMCFYMALCSLVMSSCSGIGANYREVEELLVIQTMGLDSLPGGVGLSLAVAPNSISGLGPVRLSGSGSTIAGAIDDARRRSYEEELFYSNVNNILIGEKAAREGIGEYMSYICQSPEFRVDTPVFLIKGATAEDCIMKSGDEVSGISDILQGLRICLENRGGIIYSASDIVRSSLRNGSALVCALELSESSQTSSGSPKDEEEKTPGEKDAAPKGGKDSPQGLSPAVCGYGIIKDRKLCGYIDLEDALGLSFLTDHVGTSEVKVRGKSGGTVTLQISGGGSDISPRRGENGQLTGLDISADVSACVVEIEGKGDLSDGEYADFLTARLEEYVSDKIGKVLKLSGKLGADFAGLASRVEPSDPRAFRSLSSVFSDLLPSLELRVSVRGELKHTNDIKDTWT